MGSHDVGSVLLAMFVCGVLTLYVLVSILLELGCLIWNTWKAIRAMAKFAEGQERA